MDFSSRLYIKNLIAGKSRKESARLASIPMTALKKIESDEDYEDEFNRQLAAFYEDRRVAFQPLVEKALQKIALGLDSKDPKVAAAAAEYILNQFYGKPPNRSEVVGSRSNPVRVVVESAIPRPGLPSPQVEDAIEAEYKEIPSKL